MYKSQFEVKTFSWIFVLNGCLHMPIHPADGILLIFFLSVLFTIAEVISELFFSMNLQAISESKLKAFNIGTMNIGKKGLSKKEQEELKRKVSIINLYKI